MDSLWNVSDDNSGGIADPFANIEIDANSQTGSDWFTLMLSASLGGMSVHGVTFAATCETLAKTTEEFAKKHAVGRVYFNDTPKNVKHAGAEWDEKVLMGKAFHGTKTGNKSRILFDTGEWEPSIRTRAKNAAITGALLVNTGAALDEATMVVSAIAGEPVPQEAIVNAETPLSVLKREASSIAKSNHVVYSKGNAQQAVTWQDHQMHVDKLPVDAAMDWSRVTTIARYLGEANSRYDPDFKLYARHIGVPYVIISRSWAHVNAGDYLLDTDQFAQIPTNLAGKTPGPELIDAYSDHQQNLYDAIHRMALELETGISDPTMDALVSIAMNAGSRGNRLTSKVSTGSDVINEATRHRFGADDAAKLTSDSATSWNSLCLSLRDLKKGNPALARAFNEVHLAFRSQEPLPDSTEVIYSELTKSAVWIRASHHLGAALGNVTTANKRMSELKRSMLNNSSTLTTSQVSSQRTREAIQSRLKGLVRDVAVGKVPKLLIPVAPALSTRTNTSMETRRFMDNVTKHLNAGKIAWSKRYQSLASVYGSGAKGDDRKKAIKYGVLASAFAMLTSNTLLALENGFVDPTNAMESYLVHTAGRYRKKRNLPKFDTARVMNKTAKEQAEYFDEVFSPTVPFVEVEEYCFQKLSEFYQDVKLGMPSLPDEDTEMAEAPNSDDDVILTPVDDEAPPPAQAPSAIPASLMAMLNVSFTYAPTAESVLQSYTSEALANRHAEKNGYSDFYEAYADIGTGARYDIETPYTEKALTEISKDELAKDKNPDEFTPSLEQ